MQNQENPIKRFDRHAEMDGETRSDILDIIHALWDVEIPNYSTSSLKNWLYGLFDGYYYDEELATAVSELNNGGFTKTATRIENIIKVVETYKLT